MHYGNLKALGSCPLRMILGEWHIIVCTIKWKALVVNIVQTGCREGEGASYIPRLTCYKS